MLAIMQTGHGCTAAAAAAVNGAPVREISPTELAEFLMTLKSTMILSEDSETKQRPPQWLTITNEPACVATTTKVLSELSLPYLFFFTIIILHHSIREPPCRLTRRANACKRSVPMHITTKPLIFVISRSAGALRAVRPLIPKVF